MQEMRKTRPAVLAWQSAAVVTLFRCFIRREKLLLRSSSLSERGPIYGPVSQAFGHPGTQETSVCCGCAAFIRLWLRVSAGDSAQGKVMRPHTGGKMKY